MRLEYCDKKINFGDTLNEWIWPKLINANFKNESKSAFLGIGTILTSNRITLIEKQKNKKVIIFSSGAWGSESLSLNKEWKVYGVRGPKTAKLLGLSPELAIGDGAYLIRNFFKEVDVSKNKGVVGFIPHHGSEMFVNWDKVCTNAGLKYISPQQQPEVFISKLSKCSLVITEAMHGAIAADALRIPWMATKFSPKFQETKWYDWAEVLNIKLKIHKLPFIISKKLPLNRVFEDFVLFYIRKLFFKRKKKE